MLHTSTSNSVTQHTQAPLTSVYVLWRCLDSVFSRVCTLYRITLPLESSVSCCITRIASWLSGCLLNTQLWLLTLQQLHVPCLITGLFSRRGDLMQQSCNSLKGGIPTCPHQSFIQFHHRHITPNLARTYGSISLTVAPASVAKRRYKCSL